MSSAAAKMPGNQPELFELPTPEVGAEVEAPVKVEAAEPPEPKVEIDEGVETLRKQLEELRQSERLAREQTDVAQRQQAEAVRQAQERQVQVSQFQHRAGEDRLLAVNNAIVAAQSELDRAQSDMETAGTNGDYRAMAEAQTRLSRSASRLETLENGKSDLEMQVQQQKMQAERQAQWLQQQQQQRQQQPQGDQLDQTSLPQRAKEWLRAHPDYLRDNRLNAKLQNFHYDVKEEIGEEFTDRYFTRMEEMLGMRKAPAVEPSEDDNEQPVVRQERSVPVSAPVSREAPASRTKNASQVRLTTAQREAAKLSGITEAEYAKNLIVMQEAREKGLIQ